MFTLEAKTNWLEEAKAALAKGDHALASNILAKMDRDALNVPKSEKTEPVKKKATFASGKTTETELTPLTPYWDEHMRMLDIHIPLTIFDVDWINQDLLVSMKRSSKSKDRPTGQLPKSEWWMSYADWTRASRLFVAYLREVYKHDEFANALETHFEYVIKLDMQHDWVTAFRYNIAVRSNVMCHHVDGSVADPSVKRPKFLESAKAKTYSYKDGWVRKHDNRTLCINLQVIFLTKEFLK